MDAKLQTLLHAYGEPLPTGVPPQPVDEGESVRLAETRAWLDARPRNAPDAAVLDVIFRAAAHGTPEGTPAPGMRHDRAPVRHLRPLRRAWMAVGIACSLVLGGFMITVTPRTAVVPAAAPRAAAPRMMAAAPASVPQAGREVSLAPPPAASPVAPAPLVAEARLPAPPVSEAKTAAPAPAKPTRAFMADESDDRLDLVKARAARLRTRLDSALWDAPAVTLTLPAGTQGGRFSAVSSQD